MKLLNKIAMKLYSNYYHRTLYPWNTVEEEIKKPYLKIAQEIIDLILQQDNEEEDKDKK